MLKRIAAGSSRLLVEFPLQQDSPDIVSDAFIYQRMDSILTTFAFQLASLAADLLKDLASGSTLVVCFADSKACQEARKLGLPRCQQVDEPFPKKMKASTLALVGATPSQAERVVQARKWSSVILVNPSWTPALDSKHRLMKTFETAYSFMPLMVKGFLGGKEEGCLMKCLSDDGSKWNIFLKVRNLYSLTLLAWPIC